MTTALITGASSGIGAEFARQLAAKCQNLVLVARSEDRLILMAEQLCQQHNIQTKVIVQDLTAPEASLSVHRKTKELGLSIDLLVNNAGFGDYGFFAEGQLSRQTPMIQLNITALVELTHFFCQRCWNEGKAG